MNKTIELKDVSAGLFKNKLTSLKFDIVSNPTGICIRPRGYGDKTSMDGKGFPIVIEFDNGVPRIIVWNDINVEEPTIISLHNAKESLRKS